MIFRTVCEWTKSHCLGMYVQSSADKRITIILDNTIINIYILNNVIVLCVRMYIVTHCFARLF